MQKGKTVLLLTLVIIIFAACSLGDKSSNNSKMESSATIENQPYSNSEEPNYVNKESTYNMNSEEEKEVRKILEEAKKQMESVEQEKKEYKKNRISSKEPTIKIIATVNGIFTKPESGLDLYQLSVSIESIENDKNNIYHNSIGKEYEYFLSKREFDNFNFPKLKNGDRVAIETFQDAYMTPSDPQQIDSEDIVSISLVE